ncbi:MAG: flagellar hook-basal body complex protein FliE [Nitrospinales bacterium]
MTDITTQSNLKAILEPGLRKAGKTGASESSGEEKSFADVLSKSIAKVNALQKEADNAIENLVSGKTQNIHETMLAVGKADMAFRMTMQVRNKIVEAYQEVLRIQV